MFDTDDNFVEVGTALEPLEEDEVPKKKPVNISDQIVVDENGRRRFHGAFTGGFSAGYYNTVGSKEGWEPSTFKSTRTDRLSKKTQNIQDFMDEEDLGAFGIAPQILRPTGDFEKKDSRKRAKATPSDGPIPGEPVLDMIIQPVRDTVGMRILQRMGWRPGKGVGPRTHRSKQAKSKHKGGESDSDLEDNHSKSMASLEDAAIVSVDLNSKVYGCPLPPGLARKGSEGDDSMDSDDDLDANVLFAPDDLESPLCNPKENTYGLGYKGLDRNALAFGHGHIDLFSTELKFRVENKKLNIKGEAFGVGAFEDDDEEVYSREDISQYDFALETQEERKKRLANEKKMKNSKKEPDGAIKGFTTAKHPPLRRKYFAPPVLPKDFEPVHLKRKSRFQSAPEPQEVQIEQNTRKHGLDRHKLTVEERQVLLGEAKERLADRFSDADSKLEDTNNDQLQRAQEKSERLKKFAEVLQAFSANKTAQVDSLGRPCFKPFMKNPEKQDRYDKYMTLVAAGYKECLKDLQPPDMTEWQREREKMEFERASALYKPISEVMSSRFVSAQSHDISHVVPIKEVAKVKDPTQDPKVAAKMNLFGKLTHESLEWHPDRLLCKRMNVPHPYPDSKMVGVRLAHVPNSSTTPSDILPTKSTTKGEPTLAEIASGAAPIRKSLFDNLDFSKPPPGLLPAALLTPPDESSEPPPPGTEDYFISSTSMQIDVVVPTSNVSSETLQTAPESTPPQLSRPPVDLFKEIFADTSSESEDEETSVTAKSNYKSFDKASTDKNQGSGSNSAHTKGNETSSQLKTKNDQKVLFNSRTESSSKSNATLTNKQSAGSGGKNNHHQGTQGIKSTVNLHRSEIGSEEDEQDDVYGPKPPSNPTHASIPIPKTSASTSTSGGFTFLNQAMRRTAGVAQEKVVQEEEAEWVEKGKDSSFSSRKSNKSSSSSHHHHHHKSKKSKEKQKSKHKSSKKKKHKSTESKHRSGAKRKKSKSQDDRRSHSKRNEEDDDDDDDGDSEDEKDNSASASTLPVQIHQSLSNKALLSKLKELTR